MYAGVHTLPLDKNLFTGTIRTLMDKMDKNLWDHSVHVYKLCRCLYQYLPSHMQNRIDPVIMDYASLMHDVGKIRISEDILNKPDQLTAEEWEAMRMHPKMALNMLKPLPYYPEISKMVLYHHERMDGNGYYGISGDKLPLGARMIAVCDTYSAITMRRPYKAPKSYKEAMEIIASVAGTQLDEELVSIFLQIPKYKIEACSMYSSECIDIVV